MVDIPRLLHMALSLAEHQHPAGTLEKKAVEQAITCGFTRLWTCAVDWTAQSERLVLVAHAEARRDEVLDYAVGSDLEARRA